MKKTSKALLLMLCAVLLVAASVLGTMAYLTSTDTVTNTFTVGKVEIKLDEAKVGTDGKALTGNDAARVKANDYHLLPGGTYDKDPTVTVKAPSEKSYVRMLVTVTFGKTLTDEKLATNLDGIFIGYDSAWVRNAKDVQTVEGKTVITYEYRYNSTVSATTADVKLPPLFTGIAVPGTWTNDDLDALGSIKIDIVAQAIQADGFTATADQTAADVAWEAFGA